MRFCERRGLPAPDAPEELPIGELVTLSVDHPTPRRMTAIPGQGTRRRHLRKYAEGNLGDDRASFFRGADRRLNLKAANLMLFLDLGEGVDSEPWEFHRKSGDYSRWLALGIKDRDLTAQVDEIERSTQPADATRAALEARYRRPE